MTAVERVHDHLLGRGWAVADAAPLGFPPAREVAAALSPYLQADPRAAGKHHARDVLAWSGSKVTEHPSVAHVDGTDDYSRFRLLGDHRTVRVAEAFLSLIPPVMARDSGRMSADFFRYAPGSGAEPHRDGFGDLVAIWVLDRSGLGADSFLIDGEGRDVMRGALAAGTVLMFRDEMFLHGVTPLASGHRDALIFIRLKDGA